MSSRRIKAVHSEKHDPGAVEFIQAELWMCERTEADAITEAIVSNVSPKTLEAIASTLGWCHNCQGTGFVSGHPVEECGDVPCGECS